MVLLTGALTTLLTGGVSLHAGAQRSTGDSALVFENVTIVDVEHGKLLAGQRVVVAGNRITAVGPVQRVRRPSGARVVDARGKYLIPGLWDMHVHPASRLRRERDTEVFYPLLVANGVTGIRNASSPIPLDSLRLLRQEILAGSRIGPPRQVLSGPMIQTECDGIDPNWCAALPADSDSTDFAASARRLVDSLKRAGADMLKLRDLDPATAYFTIADEARRVGMRFGGHTWDSIDVEASNRGASIIDHLKPWYDVPSGLRGQCWTPKPTASLERCRAVAELFKRNHTWVVPTLSIIYRPPPSRYYPRTRRTDALVRQLQARTAEFFGGSLLHGNWIGDPMTLATTRPANAPDTATFLPDSLGVLRLMGRTDFPIAAGTDATDGWDYFPPGFRLHIELAIYVAEGLTAWQALRSATLEPARLLGATDSLGTVARGKLADLVLLDANPLADITNTTAIRAVVANGRYFDRAALDRLLTDVQVAGQPIWKASMDPNR